MTYKGLPKHPYTTLLKKVLPDDVDDTNKHVRNQICLNTAAYRSEIRRYFYLQFLDQYLLLITVIRSGDTFTYSSEIRRYFHLQFLDQEILLFIVLSSGDTFTYSS